jgi:hypothetical protein
MLYCVHLTWARLELTTLVVICTDCTKENCISIQQIKNEFLVTYKYNVAPDKICIKKKWKKINSTF